MTGERLSLAIFDRRNDDAFLSSNAKKSIKNFNGTYSLVVLRDDGSGNLIGAYDLDSLLKEIFKHRLANEGVKVIATADKADAGLEILLKEFKLDIVDRKWVLRMSYQAESIKKRWSDCQRIGQWFSRKAKGNGQKRC